MAKKKVAKKKGAKGGKASKTPKLIKLTPTPPTLTATAQGHNFSLDLLAHVTVQAIGQYQIDVNLAAYPAAAGGGLVASGVASFLVNGIGLPITVPIELTVLQYKPPKGAYRLMGDISGTDASGNETDLGFNQITYAVP
jgi:hypothetical protein